MVRANHELSKPKDPMPTLAELLANLHIADWDDECWEFERYPLLLGEMIVEEHRADPEEARPCTTLVDNMPDLVQELLRDPDKLRGRQLKFLSDIKNRELLTLKQYFWLYRITCRRGFDVRLV